ncbi:hypothetical protein GF342_01280 [Candidatus Woesearchaeota archaeon]|nr:hypothetical protein [Candidatus Woesearchaeota archaeon]
MALLFMLAADCKTKEKAEAFAQHFEGKSFELSDGFISQLSCNIFKQGGAYWVRVMPSGCGQSGITRALEDRFNEIAEQLYTLLKTAPPYRYAVIEVEAESYRDYDELLDNRMDVEQPGLVVSEQIWNALGKPPPFDNFVCGYKWIPFEQFKLRGPR